MGEGICSDCKIIAGARIPLYTFFDIDSLDPAFAPGTGTPETGGLYTRETFPMVGRLCAECNVVGFGDIFAISFEVMEPMKVTLLGRP